LAPCKQDEYNTGENDDLFEEGDIVEEDRYDFLDYIDPLYSHINNFRLEVSSKLLIVTQLS
jgi:hypothetical protein